MLLVVRFAHRSRGEYACLPSVSFRVPSSLSLPSRDHYSLRRKFNNLGL